MSRTEIPTAVRYAITEQPEGMARVTDTFRGGRTVAVVPAVKVAEALGEMARQSDLRHRGAWLSR